jgi:hypothetical protein
MSLVDFALSDLSGELDNGQCRALIGHEIKINGLTDDSFHKAIENLDEHFASFGIVEDFVRSLLLFRHDLKWAQYPYYAKLNVHPENTAQKVSPDVREAIATRNQWDMALYELVLARFRERIKRLSDMESDLTLLAQLNGAYRAGISTGLRQNQPASRSRQLAKSLLRLVRRRI